MEGIHSRPLLRSETSQKLSKLLIAYTGFFLFLILSTASLGILFDLIYRGQSFSEVYSGLMGSLSGNGWEAWGYVVLGLVFTYIAGFTIIRMHLHPMMASGGVSVLIPLAFLLLVGCFIVDGYFSSSIESVFDLTGFEFACWIMMKFWYVEFAAWGKIVTIDANHKPI